MDHETSGAQEWMLPGYGRVSLKTHPKTVSQHGPSLLQTSPGKEAGRPVQGQTPKPSNHAHSPVPVRGASRTPRGRGAFQPLPGQANTSPRNSSRLFRDSPSKAKWRSGQEPTGAVHLPAHFGAFKREFFGLARATATGGMSQSDQGRYEAFEDICKKTGAYIKGPAYTDQVIQLWGEPAQVNSAKDMLQKLISKARPSAQKEKKKTEWAKIYAHSVDKEAGVDWKEKRESMILQLGKEPDSPSAFPEKLLFLWPKEGPSITESLGPKLEALDMVRAKFGCFLYVPKDLPDYICALGSKQDAMRQIAWRLRTKWTETVANCSLKAKVYFVEPPEPSHMKTEVIVKKDSYLTKTFLQGDRLRGTELADWSDRAQLIQSRNNARLLSTVEKSLQGVSLVRGHLRMRVNVGTFVLDSYRRPADDKPSYSFEGYREMLMHEQTKGRLIPGLNPRQNDILDRCFKAYDLLEPYENTSSSLEKAEPAFSVNFEFLGNNSALLRLEAEFAKRPGAQEYEITQRRWLRPRKGGQSIDSRPPLQITVVDFERCDWQVEIKSLEFHEPQSIDAALRAFSHSIDFQCTTDTGALTAKPQRKVNFPDSAPVSRFIEKTAIRYRLKGTQYILEIARYDEYRRTMGPAFPGQDPTTINRHVSEVPFTSWGASVFDSKWDNLLGEHANLPVGLSTRYSSDLDTFFRPTEKSDTAKEASGFWQFIDLVKQVAELLESDRVPSKGKPEQGAGKPSETDTSATAPEDVKDDSPKDALLPQSKEMSRMIDDDLGTLF